MATLLRVQLFGRFPSPERQRPRRSFACCTGTRLNPTAYPGLDRSRFVDSRLPVRTSVPRRQRPNFADFSTVLALYHHGFEVGRYISLERLIEESKEDYYAVLQASSTGWHEGKHDLLPWLNYFLAIVRRAYVQFEERAGEIKSPKGAKSTLDFCLQFEPFRIHFGSWICKQLVSRRKCRLDPARSQ